VRSVLSSPQPFPSDSVVQDVFFQTDPFKHPGINWNEEGGKYMFFTIMESDKIRIKDQGVNYGWIENCMGRDEAEKVAYKNFVSCSGTSLGTVEGMRKYLDLMWKEIKTRNCKYFGIDQGTCVEEVCYKLGLTCAVVGYHNYLLSTGEFDDFGRRSVMGKGPIMTLGTYDQIGKSMEGPGDNVDKGYTLIKRDEDGNVLLDDGSKAAAIHQYTAFWHQVIQC
jgi:hypothetical protein